MLMATIVIIGILLTAAGKQWKMIAKREKEIELLFRGNAIRNAIERYYMTSSAGAKRFPKSLNDLIVDNRGINPKRYLRKLYKDPIINDEWELIKDGRGIRGVKSKSNNEPLKKKNFLPINKEFKDKTKYSEWLFEFDPQKLRQQPDPTKQNKNRLKNQTQNKDAHSNSDKLKTK